MNALRQGPMCPPKIIRFGNEASLEAKLALIPVSITEDIQATLKTAKRLLGPKPGRTNLTKGQVKWVSAVKDAMEQELKERGIDYD